MATEGLRSADERILATLRETGPTYVPVVATRLGLPSKYAGRRADLLVDRGLIEPITGEAIYRVTERGERYLAGEAAGVREESRTADG